VKTPARRSGVVRGVHLDGPPGANEVSIRLATPELSARISRRVVKLCAWLLAAIVILVAVNVSVGQFAIPLTRVLPAMVGLSDHTSNFIVQTLRLPESMDAVLAGLALGMSGAIFQSLTGNPLASPDVLGVESGAATAAVFVIVTAGSTTIGKAGGALIGGLTTAFVVYILSYRRRGVSGYRLILTGISIAAALTSVTSYLLTRASVNSAQDAVLWLSGSLNNRGWSDLSPVALALVVMLPLTPIMTRQLGALQLGDDTSRGLGVRVEASRRGLILAGATLAAAATASAGPVPFVALVAPQLARRMAHKTTAALATAALVGAALTCGADLAGRLILAPNDLPVGVMSAILGAPYLLWYLGRTNTRGG
jgi:iron complex transport system permease protein